ncbi:MAG: GNAT family N-acetyltransferase [Firmicutes bacterium]|nr:GNAT family N-acetyltransferase [Bacillota bacterium]
MREKYYSRELTRLGQLVACPADVTRLDPAQDDDFALLQAFYRPRWPEVTREALLHVQPAWEYFAVIEDGKIVSFAGAMHMTAENWEIAGVYTLPAYRGRGLAKGVCAAVARHILEAGKRATCDTKRDNTAMRYVMDAIGMV